MKGTARILHITDVHGQLKPVYFREPNVNLGVGDAFGRPPHIVGKKLLDAMALSPKRLPRSPMPIPTWILKMPHRQYGRTGGYAHMKTLLDQLREQAGGRKNTLTLDGGDLWQGSGTSLWTRGIDMVEASNMLGLDIMVGHWEFTYREDEVLNNVTLFKGDFIGQNVRVKEDALFGDEYAALTEKYDGRGCMTRTPACLPALCHQGDQRCAHLYRRPGLPAYRQCQPAGVLPRLVFWSARR